MGVHDIHLYFTMTSYLRDLRKCREIPSTVNISFNILRYLCSIIMFPRDGITSRRQGNGIIQAGRDTACEIVAGNTGFGYWPSGGSS
jgi:hypothetical protein